MRSGVFTFTRKLASLIWCIEPTEKQKKYTHTHPFNGPLSGTTRVSRYQKGKTNLDFTEARDSEWQWHQPGRMQVCTSLKTDNHASTSPLSFLQAGCPSCRPRKNIKSNGELKTDVCSDDVNCWITDRLRVGGDDATVECRPRSYLPHSINLT